MDPALVQFTAAALAGLASKDHDRHGHAPRSAEELGREAAALGRAALAALEESETSPKAQPKAKR